MTIIHVAVLVVLALKPVSRMRGSTWRAALNPHVAARERGDAAVSDSDD